MDPDRTYELLLSTLTDGNADQAAEYADALARWIQRGGFVPRKLSHRWPDVSPRELATVHAALHEWQGVLRGHEPAEQEVNAIANGKGRFVPLTPDEIDALRQRLNAA